MTLESFPINVFIFVLHFYLFIPSFLDVSNPVLALAICNSCF
ncbi:hypothetical protein Lalb_Chr03g0042601 [Lupinus albus]|uniref:Uncharacterized protein n=1 Tax=Lupinus albus TaxID=3870 RepID=A0A6A4QYN5_LUPAL|nr:hypothetical protein Lalb_Chr03g0042601 [Lupinus albus]